MWRSTTTKTEVDKRVSKAANIREGRVKVKNERKRDERVQNTLRTAGNRAVWRYLVVRRSA